ncbi:MAG: hypothetical protein M1541_12120, partial [Acidobacteria bacterium]|nr:hypothetical protein [Acidobacteriota bacterium]
MDSATVVPSAFIFTNPSGQAIAINSVQELGLNRWRLRFSGQTTTGLYTVAYKDSLTDLAGNPLDLAHSTSAAFNLVAVDLELGSVSVSTNQLWAGDPITISWTGRNATGAPLLGAWTDAVYLSRDGNWDIGDIRLGTVTHSGGLAENETYSASVAVNVPGVLPGDYYLLVRGDIANTERETGEANNLVAYGPVPLDVPGLTPNGPAHTGTLTPGNRAQYYAITLAPGESLRLNLTGTAASGANELHVSLGAIPTRQQADFSAKGGGQNQQIVLTGAPGGATYYVLVYGDQLDAAGNPFALTAETGALFVTSIAPRRHGNISPATVTITGAGFDETTGVQFVPTNGPVRVPVGIEVVSSSTLRANLDLTNWLAGFYTVRVTKGTNAVELANAFQVIEGGYSHLVTRLIVPSAVGFNIPIRQTIWIEYANDGDAPMPVPLLVLRGDHGARMTADPALAVPRAGFGVIDGLSDTVQLLAFGDPSTPWLLQPGESRRMPVYYLGLAEKSHYPTVTFTLDAITSSDTRPLDPTGTGEPFRVSGLNNERWAAFAPLFQQVTGPTWGSYITALSQQVSDMSVFGLQPDSLQGVWNAIRLSFIPDWARNLLIDIPAKHLALVPPPAPPSDCHPQWDMYIDYLIKWDQANQAYEHAQNVQDEFQFAVAGNVGEALSRTVLIAAELRLFTFILPELQEAYAAAGMEANFQKLKTGVTVAYYSAKLVVAAIESGGDLNDMVAKVNALSKVYRQLMEQARADQQAFDNLVANLPASSPLLTVYLKALGWIAKALSWVSYIDSIERIFTDIPRTHQALVNALAAYDNESPPGAYQRAKAALDALKAMPECPPSEEDPSVKAGPFGPGEGKDYSTVDMSLVAVAPSGDLSHVVIELIAVNCPVEIDWPAVTVTVNDELVPVSGTTDEWNIGQEGKDGIMVPSKWLFGLPHCDVGCKPVIWSFRVTAYTTSGRSGSGIFNYSYAP